MHFLPGHIAFVVLLFFVSNEEQVYQYVWRTTPVVAVIILLALLSMVSKVYNKKIAGIIFSISSVIWTVIYALNLSTLTEINEPYVITKLEHTKGNKIIANVWFKESNQKVELTIKGASNTFQPNLKLQLKRGFFGIISGSATGLTPY